MMRRAVFLDRDGVINRVIVRDGKPYPPASPHELELLPGVPEALERLHEAGYMLIVVTNQPDVARGTQTRAMVEELNQLIKQGASTGPALPIDEFRVCYHDDHEGCACRKPQPGMLLAAAAAHQLDLKASYMVGDRWRDIEAGHQAGCTTIFIDYRYAEQERSQPHVRVRSLTEATEWILAETAKSAHTL